MAGFLKKESWSNPRYKEVLRKTVAWGQWGGGGRFEKISRECKKNVNINMHAK